MKISKYNIKIERRTAIKAVNNFAILLTLFLLITDNNSKICFYIALFISITSFAWKTFWFNYYLSKKNNKMINNSL